MPERTTRKRARRDAREGKSPSTQAGEFVREEIEHLREGKHGAQSTKQAIALIRQGKTKDAVKEDQLRQKARDEMEAIRKGYYEFTGGSSEKDDAIAALDQVTRFGDRGLDVAVES